MKEKKFRQKRLLCLFVMAAMLMMYIVPSIGLGTKVYADELLIPNQQYTLTSTTGERVATTANPGETTVLIFGYVGCGKTRTTLNSISNSNWVKRSDIRVIFADVKMNDQETVEQYEVGYNCPDMIFCYRDQDDTMLKIMSEYSKRCNNTSQTLPMILLIDSDNNIRNLLTGTKTADELLNEIKKFHDMDESGSGTPENPDSGIENFAYGLHSIEGTTVSTKANPNETTVLLFGHTGCAYTKSTLQSIDKSDWAGRSDIRVIFAECQGASLAQTKEYAQNFTSGNIIFCYDESIGISNLSFQYCGLYNLAGGTYPFIALIDQYNKIQSFTLGPKTAEDIITEIEKFTENNPTTPDDSTTTPPSDNNPAEPGGDDQNPGDNPGNKPGDGDNSGTTTPGDGDNSGTTTPGDGNNSGTTTPGDGDNSGTTTPGDGDNSGTTTPGDDNNSGTTTPGSSTGSSNSNSGNTSSNILNIPVTSGSTTGTVTDNKGGTSENTPETIEKDEDTDKDTATSDTVNQPEDTDIPATDDPSTTTDPSATTGTTVKDNTDKSESDAKPAKTTKKKAQVKSVKTVKGKKVVSGTIKLNSGKVVKNATIEIYVNGKKITTVKTDSTGKFSTKLSKKLKKGDKVKLVVTSKTIKKFTDVIKVK